MLRVLIIGATSAIAEAVARLYADQGAALFLVARKQEPLAAIADDLRIRGASAVATYCLDVTDFSAHAAMLDAAWSALAGVDVALIAHGTLPDQAACEASVEIAMREFTTNGTATIALSAILAQRLQANATLAVISSWPATAVVPAITCTAAQKRRFRLFSAVCGNV